MGKFRGSSLSFNGLINYAIQTDEHELLYEITGIIRCLLLLRASQVTDCWPARDLDGVTCLWRGGSFHKGWRKHFSGGTVHRIPSFVSMFADRDEARVYIEESSLDDHLLPVE